MIPAALTAFAALALAGCVSLGQDNGPPPDPTAADVVDARRAATRRADAALDEAARALEGRIVARTSTDECYEGQNNYKVHDGYDHRCTLRRAVVVGFDGDFRERIDVFDRRLFAAGWDCGGVGCGETNAELVEEYWDFRKPEYGGNDPPISVLPTTSFYQRDGLYIDVGYVSATHPSGRVVLDGWHRRQRGGLFTSYERPRPFDADAVLARVARYDYAVALAFEADYFEDDDIG
jgi:hypothetical protein